MNEKDEIYKKRHSLAHILAIAILDHDSDAKITLGPPVSDGFYYDIEFSKDKTPTPTDIKKMEKSMRKLVGRGLEFEKKEISTNEALELFKGNQYKEEIISELSKSGKTITVYTSGDFTDLCEGPHVNNTKEIDPKSFKLDRTAGAYWRGNEKNAMLTRIYGLAFNTKEDLADYLALRIEAKKRDHRKIGKELDLFTFSELVGSGLPLWTPRGTIIRTELDKYVWELREKFGYQRVTIPHITKRALYETSGHWSKFSDELFRITTREGKEYALKPMNCPHHTQIYSHKKRSYKDLPQRYAETTTVYRDEQSGELGGLTRVLSITQDDAHVFCRQSQIKDEFFAVWDIIDTFYTTFKFEFKKVRLSFHDPENLKAYLGNKETWDCAESMLLEIAKERGSQYYVAKGEAAMYGPKLDFVATDSLGREHQVATIQLDMNLPERFDLTCTNEKNEEERIVMIHAAIMGSIERFTAVLIEHLYGRFPTWLSPAQIIILPIGEKHRDYAQNIYKSLKNAGVRAEINIEDDTLGKKIREVKMLKTPYFAVIGDKEIESKTVNLESRDNDTIGEKTLEDLIVYLQKEISSRR